MNHILVIGGTGMLKDTCAYLAKKADHLSLVARHPEKLSHLNGHKAELNFITVDYHDAQKLQECLEAAVKTYGNFDLVVCWTHGSAPDAPYIIAEVANKSACMFVHVLGSAVADPGRPQKERNEKFASYQNLAYKEVILGFVVQDNHSRWLTNEEISQGTIKAIESNEEQTIVGVVEPWSRRP